MALQNKAFTKTGDEKKVITHILRARRKLDTVGGTIQAEYIRAAVDDLLTQAYIIMTTGEHK